MSRILKTAYLSGSQVVTTLSTLIIAAVLSRVLESKADYGTYQQTLLVYTFLAPLLALGLPAASFYFCSKSEQILPVGAHVSDAQSTIWTQFEVIKVTTMLIYALGVH